MTYPDGWDGDEVAMVFGSDGNAVDCFDYTAEELQARVDTILGRGWVSMRPSLYARLVCSNERPAGEEEQ